MVISSLGRKQTFTLFACALFALGGVAKLRKAGFSRADQGGLKPGDEVTATALPARNGSNIGYLMELKVADGRDFKFTTEQN